MSGYTRKFVHEALHSQTELFSRAENVSHTFNNCLGSPSLYYLGTEKG